MLVALLVFKGVAERKGVSKGGHVSPHIKQNRQERDGQSGWAGRKQARFKIGKRERGSQKVEGAINEAKGSGRNYGDSFQVSLLRRAFLVTFLKLHFPLW